MAIQTITCADGHAFEAEVYRTPPERCPEHRKEHKRKMARARHLANHAPVTGQPVTLVCWAGHEWEWPRRKGERPKACPEHDAERKREYFARQNRKYHAENAEAIAARKRAYRATPEGAETVRAASRRRRARRAGAATDGTDPTWQKVAERDGLECSYCPVTCDPTDFEYITRVNGTPHMVCGPTYPTLDHVIPLISGGAHSMDNAALACYRCNSEKNRQLL
jgi:5-methylcytosine-specific restriction endonuclease McrA